MPANPAEFERCWPWLEASLNSGGYVHDGQLYPTHSRLDVWNRIVAGRAFLWPGVQCALLTEILNHPTGLRSQNTWLAGGDDLDEIVALMPMIEQWGRRQGCHREVGNGRRGWLRKFTGYSEMGVRKQKDLLLPGEPVCLPVG
jgi:hypothetical protein